MSVMKCDTHHIHIRSSVTTGKSLHQHETGSWSSWENTETLIREEFAWIPFIAAAANYCSMSSQKSDQFNFYSGLLTTRTTYELWDMNLLFIFWTAGIHSDKTINIKKKTINETAFSKGELAEWSSCWYEWLSAQEKTNVGISALLCKCFICSVMQLTAQRKIKCNKRMLFLNFFFSIPEIASSIFLRAPKVVIPSSFRSWSVSVRNVWRSI